MWAMLGRTIGAIFLSMVALSGSFVVAIILTILLTRDLEPPDAEIEGTEA
jgi:hypothetical protein